MPKKSIITNEIINEPTANMGEVPKLSPGMGWSGEKIRHVKVRARSENLSILYASVSNEEVYITATGGI